MARNRQGQQSQSEGKKGKAGNIMITTERPLCRKIILKRGLQPFIQSGKWDGLYHTTPDGGVGSGFSDGLRKQMTRMVEEGHWGTSSSTAVSVTMSCGFSTTKPRSVPLP
jgi:hypothetical protein